MIVFARTENIAILSSGCPYLNWQQHSLYERWVGGGGRHTLGYCMWESDGGRGRLWEGRHEMKKRNVRCHAHSLAGSTKPWTGTKGHSFWAPCVAHKDPEGDAWGPEETGWRPLVKQAAQIPWQQRQETKSKRSRCIPKLPWGQHRQCLNTFPNCSNFHQARHNHPGGEVPEWPLERRTTPPLPEPPPVTQVCSIWPQSIILPFFIPLRNQPSLA